MNQWKEVWSRYRGDLQNIDMSDKEAVFMKLKMINGFDVLKDGISYKAFLQQYKGLKKAMRLINGESVFEVGCGSGANLYLFHMEDCTIGGDDYSESMIHICKMLFQDKIKECNCREANELSSIIKYDHVFSNSVFSYFNDLSYAEEVLTRMVQKAKKSIILLDVHDKEKQEDFAKYRRKIIPDYDTRYEGLNKMFYGRSFFTKFAEEHNLDIGFSKSDMPGYWNNDFIYNVIMHKRLKIGGAE